MDDLLNQALRASRASGPERTPRVTLVVAGGGGVLGSAVLERVHGAGQFAAVRVLVTQPLRASVAGLEPVRLDARDIESGAAPAANAPALASTAVIVLDAKRHANGREDAFLHPEPRTLPPLARWLHARGVRDLVVVMPHRAARLPQALKAGLADLDEHGVVEAGFERVVFVRSAQPPQDEAPGGPWLQRVADGVLAQLRVMTPQAEQPVRAAKVAQFVAELAAQLPRAAPGTRVAPPELVWQAAQMPDSAPLARAWLAGETLPPLGAPRMRL